MGRLTKADRDAKIEALARLIVETGETRHYALADAIRVGRNHVGPLVEAARKIIARECPPPTALRQTFLAQSAVIYRKAIEGHERAKTRGDDRVANEFLKTASDALRTASKLGGIDELRPESGTDTPNIRIVFESWGDSAPAAALAAATRLSTAPIAKTFPRQARTL